MENEKPEGAITIFVLGILGLIACQLLGIIAWVQGNTYLAQCRAAEVEPEGLAVAGRVLGIIATILFIGGLFVCLIMMAAAAS